MEWAVLRGLANFHLKYKGRYSREGLIYKAGLDGILTLLRRAKAHAEIMGGAVHIAFMVVLQECYDKGRRGNRLEKDKA